MESAIGASSVMWVPEIAAIRRSAFITVPAAIHVCGDRLRTRVSMSMKRTQGFVTVRWTYTVSPTANAAALPTSNDSAPEGT